jgi:hypothetical protein
VQPPSPGVREEENQSSQVGKPKPPDYHGPPGQEDPDIPDYPRAWFYPILPWGAPVSAFPLDRLRGNKRMIAWELIVLAFCMYNMVEVPYRLFFGMHRDLAGAEEDLGLPVCEWGWKVAIDCISYFVFAIDIVFQMHSAFFKREILELVLHKNRTFSVSHSQSMAKYRTLSCLVCSSDLENYV